MSYAAIGSYAKESVTHHKFIRAKHRQGVNHSLLREFAMRLGSTGVSWVDENKNRAVISVQFMDPSHREGCI